VHDASQVIGVRYVRDNAQVEARARVVINAAGPWAPEVAAMAGQEIPLRPAKGIHLVYDRRLSNFVISTEAIDGRDILLVPHGPITILGTTDDDYFGDLDDVEVLGDEVDYLLQAMARVFPAIERMRPVRATTGIRPTLYDWRPNEDRLSRRHQLFQHPHAPGLLSITGGKLSMYRLMAEETADAACRRLGVQALCRTAELPLPGSEADAPPAAELAREHRVTALAAARTLGRHGCRAAGVLGEARHGRLACRCEHLAETELAYAARQEQARSLADAFRRVGLAAGPCAGAVCVDRAAQVLGRELGWSAAQQGEAAREFLLGAWLGRSPLLERRGWAQEELAYAGRRGYSA
jgi:glycerol-3-phosphate dehydrogenase